MEVHAPPLILSLMRHEESAENVVFNHGDQGGEHPAFEKVTSVPTWLRPLSTEGVARVEKAGAWFRAWRRSQRNARRLYGYASHYLRARETAARLRLGLRWKLDVRPCERNWGLQTYLSDEMLKRHFPLAMMNKEKDSLLWSPVNGDSMQLVITYIYLFLTTLARDHSDDEVIVVTHGEALYGFQYILDHWLPEELTDAMNGRGKIPRLENGAVVQYSRIDDDGSVHSRYVRKRFVNTQDPVDPETNTPWFSIPRERTFSEAELLEQVGRVERHV